MSETRERIVQAARRLAQQRGFNAFSYADISDAVGIRKASIHHHFASKEDLELELVSRYLQEFLDRLAVISQTREKAAERLRSYGALYLGTLDEGGICLCGMMASDIGALAPTLRVPLRAFFEDQAGWLAWVLQSGREAGELAFAANPSQQALTVLATLEGGLLVAHALQDRAVFESLLENVIAGLALQ
jgi:TetR/AcrR family transcriptional repressor of nem operon